MTSPSGLDALKTQPLMQTLMHRRTHRVSQGVKTIMAGSMTYRSTAEPHPLSPLEEAVLIAATGHTGLTMPDRPFQDPASGAAIMAKPNLTMDGRTAGSPDNSQGTHFIMINDTGTYYLDRLPSAPPGTEFTDATLLERAAASKRQILDHRIDVKGDRDFPAYLDSNRFLSNQPGTTLFFPVVDLSHQYINGLMYLLTQPDGARPAIVDDRNFYRSAGVDKWVRKGFLNNDIKLPLGIIGMLRTQIEAVLLLQNLFLTAEAMGLGAWIHASLSPPVLMGDPKYITQYGPMLGFDFATPKFRLLDILRWQVPLPKYTNLRAHPIGLKAGGDYVIKAMCPPYYATMSDAVDAVVQAKFGAGGTYQDEATFARIYKGDYGARYLKEASQYSDDVIACVRDVCEYIYRTHGRFPAHCDALYAPGIWIQIHHPDMTYYDTFFQNGLTAAHRAHATCWHGPDTAA
jgi:hypothetical protein